MSDPFRITYELEKIATYPPHSFDTGGGRVYRDPSVEVCTPPGWWSRLWNGIDFGHVWECPICHTFYEFDRQWNSVDKIWWPQWAQRDEEWAERFRKRNGL